MGIVISQSIRNTVATYIGFAIGAVNTLFLYTEFLTPEYYGLVGFILSNAAILSPLLMFGVANGLVKFFSSYKTQKEKDGFLLFMLLLPLAIIIPTSFIGSITYTYIANWLSAKNTIIKDYTWTIYVIAIASAYFEVFFSWGKVHFKSVFGNVMKEIFHRVCTFILLFAVYVNYITVKQFIYAVVIVFIIRTLIIACYAFRIYLPKLNFKKPTNYLDVIKYNILIIIAGSVANLLFELDKHMLGRIITIDNVAYYNVAGFIAMVIAVPARAMHQIVNPLTAQYLNNKSFDSLKDLYQKSSLNLLIISGFILILIVTNMNQLYYFLPEEYSKGLWVVVLISVAKLFSSACGSNNAILFNSDYYRVILLMGVCIIGIAVVLNLTLIPKYGVLGAAIATFFAFILYDSVKLWYVNYKMKLQPFTKHSLYVVALILVLSVVFYVVEFPFYPLINIALKTLIISGIYGFVILKWELSDSISTLIQTFLKRVSKK